MKLTTIASFTFFRMSWIFCLFSLHGDRTNIWGWGYHRRLVMSKSRVSGKVDSTKKKEKKRFCNTVQAKYRMRVSESVCCTVDLPLPHSVMTKIPIYAWYPLKPAMSLFNHLNWNAQETFMELQHSAMHWACYRPLVKSMAGKALQQNKSSIGPCRSQPFHPLMWNRKRRIIWHRSSHMHKWPCMYI